MFTNELYFHFLKSTDFGDTRFLPDSDNVHQFIPKTEKNVRLVMKIMFTLPCKEISILSFFLFFCHGVQKTTQRT